MPCLWLISVYLLVRSVAGRGCPDRGRWLLRHHVASPTLAFGVNLANSWPLPTSITLPSHAPTAAAASLSADVATWRVLCQALYAWLSHSRLTGVPLSHVGHVPTQGVRGEGWRNFLTDSLKAKLGGWGNFKTDQIYIFTDVDMARGNVLTVKFT